MILLINIYCYRTLRATYEYFYEARTLAAFNVHLSVGMIASGVAATSTMVAGLATQEQVIAYFILGTIGSLLPDLDADNSTPVQIAFSLASLGSAFVIMFAATALFDSVIELVVIWLMAYLVFRWLIFVLFARFTNHRGIFHSVPAAIFFGLLTAAVSHRVMAVSPLQAWMNGSHLRAQCSPMVGRRSRLSTSFS